MNVDDLKTSSKVYDDKGYETGEEEFYNAGVITESYANLQEDLRFASLKSYMRYTEEMHQGQFAGDEGAYDRVVIDRARIELMYEVYSNENGTESEYDSAAETGRAYRGYMRSSMEYFALAEGFTLDDIEELHGLISGSEYNVDFMNERFKQLVAERNSFNDRELTQ